ncbi:MAG: type II toxin-antitoxin system RelE/ParE family toxin [Bacilli bacterium]|nr:type II toxin-antitoxin system RelE/ParE family toxin [Bacilli bacterium]
MKYHVKFTDSVYKALSKLDKYTAKMLINWISDKLDGTENPRTYGKALSANLVGLWQYRVGDYRIITKIEDDKLIILIIAIGHRKEKYNK